MRFLSKAKKLYNLKLSQKILAFVLDTKLEEEEENTIRAVIEGLKGKVSFNQIFEDVRISVAGYEVYVRGRVMDGVPKIGTFFIK
jgi:hypothetical protein